MNPTVNKARAPRAVADFLNYATVLYGEDVWVVGSAAAYLVGVRCTPGDWDVICPQYDPCDFPNGESENGTYGNTKVRVDVAAFGEPEYVTIDFMGGQYSTIGDYITNFTGGRLGVAYAVRWIDERVIQIHGDVRRPDVKLVSFKSKPVKLVDIFADDIGGESTP